jgi:hypothetical protein
MATTDGRYTLYRHDPAPLVMVKETTDRSEAMNWLKGVGPSATGETA